MNPAPPEWTYVYIIKSKKNRAIYVGCTSNLKRRLKEHKDGTTFTVKKMLPIELIYFEAFCSKKDAYEREKRLKHHGSALGHLKKRLRYTQGGAG